MTLQGALLASSQRIYVPQGRAAPLAFDLASGKPLGAIGEAGGVFCLLTEDEMLLAGPNNQKSRDNQIRIADAANRRRLATFSGTNRILVDGNHAWIPSGGKLKLLDRAGYVAAEQEIGAANAVINDKKLNDARAKTAAGIRRDQAMQRQAAAWKWEVDCPAPSGFIKAADAIILGLAGEVRAYSAGTGDLIWKANVDGFVHGLAVAEARLFVSTGLGHIYVFGSGR